MGHAQKLPPGPLIGYARVSTQGSFEGGGESYAWVKRLMFLWINGRVSQTLVCDTTA